mgnify:CR=1 FL=1|tara:strand:+ start:1182 stop:2303 length:1122 start_codon:yes stop_codon:yes gene_type:complete
MKTIDSLSLNVGVEASRPFISAMFFPPPSEKYIILENSSQEGYKEYEYIDEVAAILSPFLTREKVRIIQIKLNRNDSNIFKCRSYEALSYPQINFLIKNSQAVVTNNFYTSHVADAEGVNCICLHPTEHISINAPDINNNNNLNLLSSKKTFPELICSEILDHLNIDSLISKIKPIFCGEKYNEKTIEIIPDFDVENTNIRDQNINIRADYHFDEKNIAKFIATNKSNLVTDRLISYDYLNNPYISKNLLEINYEVKLNTSPEEIYNLHKVGCNINLFCRNDKEISQIRMNHLDYEISLEKKFNKKDVDIGQNICDNVFYKSSKVIISKNNQFSSKAKWLSNKPIDNSKFEKIEDTDEFWNEVENFKLFSINE